MPVTCSTACVRRSTGLSAVRETTYPSSAARPMLPESDAEEHEPHAAKGAFHLLERTRQLHGQVAADSDGEHAEVGSLHLRVLERTALRPRRDLPCLVGHGQVDTLRLREQDVAACVDQLDECPDVGQGGRLDHRANVDAAHERRQLGRAPLQRLVDLCAKLVADDEERDQRGEDRRDGDCRRGRERETRPERHGSRSTYPKPRTVCISRGSPDASVLRRR